MAVTAGAVRTALNKVGAFSGQMRSDAVLAAGADDALRRAPAGLTARGAASFLATQAQESDYFRTTVEYPHAHPPDYAPYVGRTFEQVTWVYNYRSFGQWCADRGIVRDGEVFVQNPVALADYAFAWLGGIWYFERFDLWRFANAGDHLAVSQGVNLGPGKIGSAQLPNHWPARSAMFESFSAAGDTLLPGPDPSLRRRRTLLLNP